jgi:shikimate kinase
MEDLSRISRVVLIGFLGAGKSVVGEALGTRLEWEFVDFDAQIRNQEGQSLSEVAAAAGNEYLREAEASLTREAAQRERLVIAPGGAWITRPELLESLGHDTLSVWLRVSPSEAFDRIQDSVERHPWSDQPDALDRIGELMREREPLFRLADVSVPTNRRSPEAIAFEIEQIVRTREIGSHGSVVGTSPAG